MNGDDYYRDDRAWVRRRDEESEAGTRNELENFMDAFRMTGPGKPIDLLYAAMGGDTIAQAVEEKRCIKDTIGGCGQNLLNEDGTPKFVYDDRDTANLYYREWTITGLCGTCQDKVQAIAERAEGECCGNSPCTCEEAPAF